ncbi:MAG TPA: protein-disulfide reductase DsbD domain-containing protein [Candidatus Limnocylindrales bacterium]|nr:protein-disulfide reductase DsbD domain-containing protein [Candidatus Limnocylindrales bacterium]
MKKIALTVCLLLISALAAQAQLGPASRVTFEPMSTVAVRPGSHAPIKFVFHIQPGFHINSNKPSAPELIPTVLHLSLPGDVVIGRMVYPAGQLMSFPFDPSQKLSVYSGDVVITGRVVAPPSAAADTYTVHGDFKYQACDANACYPPKNLPITFSVKVGAAAASGRKARPNAQSPHIHN